MGQSMLASVDSTTCYIIVGVATSLAVLTWRQTQSWKQYPPGPPGKFLIGNLKDVPSGGDQWLAYEKMSRDYGSDIIHLNVLGSHMLVLNSYEAARDLLEKKGGLYSNRPRFVVLNELRGWNWNLVMMPYGKAFTAHRRIVQQEFQPVTVALVYRSIMTREVVAFLGRVLQTPENLTKHIKQMTGAIIMMVTYGHEVTSAHDEFVALAEEVRDRAEQNPAGGILELFPILRHLPAWFPGAGFKRMAEYSRQLSLRMRAAPYDDSKKRLAAGTAVPSIVSRLLQDPVSASDPKRDELIMNCAGVVYSAGADTTVAALISFFLAMVMYPDVQTRAQEEMDRAVGRDRLPTYDDRLNIPYICNVVKEVYRWKPVAPLGVPHATSDIDIYREMFIPKGTTVIANLYAILHDPAVYKDPDEFNPERYNATPENPKGEPDPSRAAFGFGRRVCPGRYFAEDSIWLTIVQSLQAFRIEKPAGVDASVYSNIKWCPGLVSFPSPFPFTITPRFSSVGDLISSASDATA